MAEKNNSIKFHSGPTAIKTEWKLPGRVIIMSLRSFDISSSFASPLIAYRKSQLNFYLLPLPFRPFEPFFTVFSQEFFMFWFAEIFVLTTRYLSGSATWKHLSDRGNLAEDLWHWRSFSFPCSFSRINQLLDVLFSHRINQFAPQIHCQAIITPRIAFCFQEISSTRVSFSYSNFY